MSRPSRASRPIRPSRDRVRGVAAAADAMVREQWRRRRGPGRGPLVTVVVTGAQSRHLDRCLGSVLAAGHGGIEIILVGPAGPAPAIRRVRGLVPTLDAAVEAATGEWLTVVHAGDVLEPGLLAEQVAAARRDGPDLVIAGAREHYRGAWRRVPRAPVLHLATTGLTAATAPGLLTAFEHAGFLAAARLWREVADSAASTAVATARLVLTAQRITVLPGPSYRHGAPEDPTGPDGTDTARLRPLTDQERHGMPRIRRFAAGLAAIDRLLASTAEGVRRAWVTAMLAHVMPELCRDSVGADPDWLPTITPWLRTAVGGLTEEDRAAIPVESRLVVWSAANRRPDELAAVLAELADHPHGLPTAAGLVTGSHLDRVPPDWRRIGPADRRLQSRIRRAVLRHDGTITVLGNAFLTYPDTSTDTSADASRPQVTIAGRPATVTRVPDRSADLWAERAFEEHGDSGFSAVIAGPPQAAADSAARIEVVVRLAGHTEHHRVALTRSELRTDQPGRPDRPGRSEEAARPVVEAARLEGTDLHLTGRGRFGTLQLVGPARSGPVPVSASIGRNRWTATLALRHDEFGVSVGLPYGQYRLLADGSTATPVDAGGITEPPPGPRHGVGPGPDGTLVLTEPLTPAERSARGQQVLRTGPHRPAQPPMVIFESFRGRSVADNPAAIAAELTRRDAGFTLGWVVDDPGVEVPAGTVPLPRRTPAWHRAMATAAGYVANAGGPPWWRQPQGQVHLQTWHGTPLKHLGEDRGPGDFWTWRHRRVIAEQARGWDALVSAGPYSTAAFRSAFGYSGEVLEIGQPRNDVLIRADSGRRAEVRRRLGLSDADRVVLYAPTWREYGGVRIAKPLYLDAARLVGAHRDLVVLVRGHYNATKEATVSDAGGVGGRVIDVTRWPDIADLYLAADVLVTDYSSVMFDFVLTDKPIILLTPDLVTYRDVERGFYFDLAADPPGPMVTTTDEVVDLLAPPATVAWAASHAEARSRYRDRFCPHDDGAASTRAVDWLLERLRR